MKRALVLMAATGALFLQVGAASALESTTGKAPAEPRSGLGGTNSPKEHKAGTGGRSNPYVSDSMARWHSGRPNAEKASVGVGAGRVFDDKALPKDEFKPRDKGQAELGGSVPLSGTVSLKAAGRYDHLGSISDKGLDGLGGNLGLRISF